MSPQRLLAHDLIVLAGLVFLIAMAVTTYRRYRRDERGVLLIVTGVSVAAFVGAAWAGEALTLLRPSRWALYPSRGVVAIGALAAVAVAVALADTADRWSRVLAERLSKSHAGVVAAAAQAVAVLVAGAATVVGAQAMTVVGSAPATPPPVVQTAGVVEATFPIPGGPIGIAMRGGHEGYLTTFSGEVIHFALPPDLGGIATTTVIDDLDAPRGIAVIGSRLYVTENAGLPCPDPTDPYCVEGLSQVEVELKTIAEADGRIHRYTIRLDGSVHDRETLLDGLPVVFFDHGINGLAEGPDGRIYASIGGLANLALYPDLMATIAHPRADLLGTIVSFEPDGSDLRVHARGLRNIYDMALTPDGRFYAVDNDGEALNALRAEELIEIVEGGHYGFPLDGSYAPFTVRTHFPLWHLEQTGTGGVAWSEDRGGVLVGALGFVNFVELGTRTGSAGPLVGSPNAVKRVAQVTGYATAIEALGGGRYLVAVLNPWEPEHNGLVVVSFGS